MALSVQEVPRVAEEEPVVRVHLSSSGRSLDFAVRLPGFKPHLGWHLLWVL